MNKGVKDKNYNKDATARYTLKQTVATPEQKRSAGRKKSVTRADEKAALATPQSALQSLRGHGFVRERMECGGEGPIRNALQELWYALQDLWTTDAE